MSIYALIQPRPIVRDYKKAEKQVSRKHVLELLAKIDYSIYGLEKNFNLSLIVSSFFLNFKDGEYV